MGDILTLITIMKITTTDFTWDWNQTSVFKGRMSYPDVQNQNWVHVIKAETVPPSESNGRRANSLLAKA